MIIGIIGGGVVGHATARTYMEHHGVRVFDYDDKKRTHCFADTVGPADLVFVCLPEKALDQFFNNCVGAGDYDYKRINWVIKSTCPIGTTRKLAEKYKLPNIVHSPEFLTARCAVTDAQLPARNIIGDPSPRSCFCECTTKLSQLYAERFQGIPLYIMTSDESEAVKLITNSFFAVKVAFFNEAYDLCESKELDWDTVMAGVLSDGRIAHSHTKVPGPDGKRGFGGACLPKDLRMFIDALPVGSLNSVAQAAEDYNLETRK